MKSALFVAVVALFAAVAFAAAEEGPGRGFPSEGVEWLTLGEARKQMAATGKPVCVIFHKPWWFANFQRKNCVEMLFTAGRASG